MIKVNLKGDKSDFAPCNITVSDADKGIVEGVLKGKYIVQYLRSKSTVGLSERPARDENRKVIEDAPWVKRRTICSGVPYGCMIAFVYGGELLIGWSKRLGPKSRFNTEELRKMFDGLLIKARDTDGADKFDMFCSGMLDLLEARKPVEVEISFSKKIGKRTAILRALNDTLGVNESGELVSGASEHLPSSVKRALPAFIKQAETAFKLKAANTSRGVDVRVEAVIGYK
jgi:hypothetical protein